MTYKEVMNSLEALASHDPKDLVGMARFGINVDRAWVISIPKLRALAKEIKKDYSSNAREKFRANSSRLRSNSNLHQLALQVWESGVHEAKILAGFIDDPSLVTEAQMEKWVMDFDSWDVTDMICGNLFDRTSFAVKKAIEWSKRSEEFVKRAGFVLMAGLAVHDKKMPDEQFLKFLEIIKREAGDGRNFVRKAVNWALRAIGKSRNAALYKAALETAAEIRAISGPSQRFIGGDAVRELQKSYIKNRFGIN